VDRPGQGPAGVAFLRTPNVTGQGTDINLEDVYNRERDSLGTLIASDPIRFVHRFKAPLDREVAGFLASQFAYGRVDGIVRFLDALFAATGPHPHAFVVQGDFSAIEPLYYRLHKGRDLVALFGVLRRIYDEHGGIGRLLATGFDNDVREALWSARERLFGTNGSLDFFFPKRTPAGPMKRWSLYLRWMVRKDAIDFGIWDFMDKRDLVVPLDTHIYAIGRCLGWTKRQTQGWNAARDITAALKAHCPEDPLKYDFLLCHRVGITGGCTGKRRPVCKEKCIVYAL